MGAMTSQITSLTIAYSAAYSRRRSKKHQSSAWLAFVGGGGDSPVGEFPAQRVSNAESPVGEFPAQRVSNAENVSIRCRHHYASDVTHLFTWMEWTADFS